MKKEKTNKFLVFTVGPYRFCVGAEEVDAIITPPSVRTIPRASRCIAGAFLFRGRVAIAVSLRALFGLAEQDHQSGQLVMTTLAQGLGGFWVDGVEELAAARELKTCPPTIEVFYRFFDTFVLRGKEVLMQTRFELLAEQSSLHRYIEPASRLAATGRINDAGKKGKQKESLAPRPGPAQEAQKPVRIEAPEPLSDDVPSPAGEEPVFPDNILLEYSRAGQLEDEKPGPEDHADKGTKSREQSEKQLRKTRVFTGSRPQSEQAGKKRSHSSSLAGKQGKPLPVSSGIEVRTSGKKTGNIPQPAAAPAGMESGERNRLFFAGLAALLLLVLLAGGALTMLWPEGASEHDVPSAILSVEEPLPKEAAKPEVRITEKLVVGTAVPEPPVKPEKQTPKPPEPPVFEDTTRQKGFDDEILKIETSDFTLTIERPRKGAGTDPAGGARKAAKSGQSANKPDDARAESLENKGVREMVHQVVRGDTLWDIAEKYFGNPFRYKDLAELSRIRDPHWIYPGDIIRFRIKMKSGENRQ